MSGTTSIYLYDGANLLEEVDNSGGVLAKYTQSDDIDEPLSNFASEHNYLLSVGCIGFGQFVEQRGGGAGEHICVRHIRQTGRVHRDPNQSVPVHGARVRSETGIYNYRARYYDTGVGRFISEDPSGFAGDTNFYAYTANNPVLYIDPSGTGALQPWAAQDCSGQRGYCNGTPVPRKLLEVHNKQSGPELTGNRWR